jgi:hypothetical protein
MMQVIRCTTCCRELRNLPTPFDFTLTVTERRPPCSACHQSRSIVTAWHFCSPACLACVHLCSQCKGEGGRIDPAAATAAREWLRCGACEGRGVVVGG